MPEGKALVYCEREYLTANGKTAHGLVRHTVRYDIVGVVDSTAPSGDAGELLDGNPRGIPLFSSLEEAFRAAKPEIFIVGAVSEGGFLPEGYDKAITWALSHGLDIVSGLHHFISDDERFANLAAKNGCKIVDVRKLFRDHKRFYTGEISHVGSTRIAVLGTDSAIGKTNYMCNVSPGAQTSWSKSRHDIYWTNRMDARLATRRSHGCNDK